MKIFIIGLISLSLLFSCSKPSNDGPNPLTTNRDSLTSSKIVIDPAQKIFIGTDSAIICYNPQNGNEIWRAFLSVDIARALAYHNGKIFCQSDSSIICLDTTGKIVWRYNVNDGSRYQASFEAVILHNKIFFVGYHGLYAIDCNNGSLVWHKQASEANNVFAGKNHVYCRMDLGTQAFDPDNGNLIWTAPYNNYHGIEYFNSVYLADGNDIYKLDALTGNLIWKQFYLIDAEEINFSNNKILLSGGAPTALDTLNGNVMWSCQDNIIGSSDGLTGPSPIVYDSLVEVTDGDFELLNLNTGKFIRQIRTSHSWIADDPTIINNILYYGDNDYDYPPGGYLYGIDLSTNKIVFKSQGRAVYNSSPCILGKSGKFYSGGRVYE